MFRRIARTGLACAIALSIVSVAVAQQVPQPVVRMGDWVEIGDETWMNIIGTVDTRLNTWHNSDFDNDVQDITNSRNPSGTSTSYLGPGDYLEAEIRFGADFRYKKNLRARVLFEAQSIYDGNLIDGQDNNSTPAVPARGIAAGGGTENSLHVERFWIDYRFNPMIRMRVGADLWKADQFGLMGDDDPALAVFITPTPDLELHVRAVVQTESQRIQLTNDNDDMYYTFGAKYTGIKGHTIQLDGAYQRFRFDPAEDADTFLIVPSYKGTLGIVQVTASAAAVFGKVDGTGGEDYDVAGFAFMANIVANLGSIRPFVGFVYGSPDDDANDNDLNGFHHLPQRDISLGSDSFEWGLLSPSMADWGPGAGANAALGGGVAGSSTTGNMFLDRLGNTGHAGTSVVYSNPGTLRLAAGAHFTPIKGHQITGYYQYVGFLDDATLTAITPRVGGYDKTLYHEITGVWAWTVNKHFDIRAIANFFVPGGGTKDIASTVTTCGNGTQACKGEDAGFRGTLRFRARF